MRKKSGDQVSKFNRLQKIILGVIITFLTLGIILRVVSGSTTGNFIYDGISMLKYSMIDYPLQTIRGFTTDFANLWQVHEENDQLRYELSKNPSYKAKYENEKAKNEELSKALKISDEDERFSHTWANVIDRDVTIWNNTITIDVGEKDGIQKDQAVVSVEGLIGKVVEVSKYTSKVKLLTSEDKLNTVSIKVLDEDGNANMGILESYDVGKGRYVITLFDEGAEIKKGMTVMTSGNGGVYPSGLLIGEVESVQALISQTGQTIYAKPIKNFQSFEYVSVVVPKGDAS